MGARHGRAALKRKVQLLGLGGCGAPLEALFSFGLEPVTSTIDGNDLGVTEQAIQDCAGGGYIAQQLTPFFDGPIGGHYGGAVFITSREGPWRNLFTRRN